MFSSANPSQVLPGNWSLQGQRVERKHSWLSGSICCPSAHCVMVKPAVVSFLYNDVLLSDDPDQNSHAVNTNFTHLVALYEYISVTIVMRCLSCLHRLHLRLLLFLLPSSSYSSSNFADQLPGVSCFRGGAEWSLLVGCAPP